MANASTPAKMPVVKDARAQLILLMMILRHTKFAANAIATTLGALHAKQTVLCSVAPRTRSVSHGNHQMKIRRHDLNAAKII